MQCNSIQSREEEEEEEMSTNLGKVPDDCGISRLLFPPPCGPQVDEATTDG